MEDFIEPKHSKGDIVFTVDPDDKELVIMCEVLGAELNINDKNSRWFYSLQGFKLAKKTDVFLKAEEDLLHEILKPKMPR